MVLKSVSLRHMTTASDQLGTKKPSPRLAGSLSRWLYAPVSLAARPLALPPCLICLYKSPKYTGSWAGGIGHKKFHLHDSNISKGRCSALEIPPFPSPSSTEPGDARNYASSTTLRLCPTIRSGQARLIVHPVPSQVRTCGGRKRTSNFG